MKQEGHFVANWKQLELVKTKDILGTLKCGINEQIYPVQYEDIAL